MTPMNVHTHSRPEVSPCGCGCSDCKGECCTLECLTRPNFFCGQVLTDDDLKALVDWTTSKGALQRFRDGWGVACGLEVTCGHEVKKGSRINVSPGYAVDCCGRDIIVCEPAWFDFTCEKPFDPCCPKPKPKNDADEYRNPAPDEDEMLGCIPRNELRAFELCIRFDEKLSGGQRAMVRGTCRPADDCQYTRVIETGKLYAKEVSDPCVAQHNKREEKYREALKLFIEDLERNSKSAKTLRDWAHGKLHSFCFVEECLCELVEQEGKRERNAPAVSLDQWFFYIIQDWRNHYFQCLCDPCKTNTCEGDGVPLARVWVWNKEKDECRVCKVVYIDSYPPYRRLLGTDCWPTHNGCIDLSRYIWRDVDEVRAEVCGAGFHDVVIGQPFDPATAKNLGDAPGGLDVICAPCDERVVIRPYRDICDRSRVAIFERVPLL